jgi:hypothetical protein
MPLLKVHEGRQYPFLADSDAHASPLLMSALATQ